MEKEILRPAKGRILISDPYMLDPNFKRTVVLLTEHNEGSIGFVLNKQTDLSINEAMKDFPTFNAPLFYGGPVQPDTLHFIHKLGDVLEGSQKILNGLFWGGNFETLKILVEQKQARPSDFKFFIGYSGWAAGQLERELEENAWLVTDANPEYAFADVPDKLWGDVLKDIGSQYAVMADFPENPSLN